MKVVVLYTRLSGYVAACLRALKLRHGAELLIYAYPPQCDAPFNDDEFSDLGEIINRKEVSDFDMTQRIRAFQADLVLVSGWADRGYLAICRQLKGSGVRIVAGCDTQWKGSLRQRVAAVMAPFYLHRSINALWVSGERQRQFALKLGFRGSKCLDGYYSCDWKKFNAICDLRMARNGTITGRDRSFLFVGRYVPIKGLDCLAEAYQKYTQLVEVPWKLICAGRGPDGHYIVSVGAEDRGFIPPSELPQLMSEVDCFILPSRFEPWGVVLHEAAAAGLPLIATDACGAAVHLLRDGFNGFSVESGSVESIVKAMLQIHLKSDEDLQLMGEASHLLSKQYQPEIWARTLVTGL